ncbi:MAG: hypothetical protein EAX90_08965 [Candidatus Heimdallarchaeota archaeon]|nr:hypothetical protein [Candidatus Heimdallarchaeota archaeon]
MSDTADVAQLKAMISAIVAHGKTGNMRAVVQTLNDFEKKTKNIKNYSGLQELQAEAYRHALEPFGVAKKFKEVENMLSRIEHLLRSKANSEDMQEIYSEALNAGIFHYIMNTQDKEINRSLARLGNFARKHQTNPFVQFNFAMSLSKVAEYFAAKDDKEVTYNILYEIIGIVTFFPGKEILTQVVDGLLQCINVAGNKLSLNELEDVSTRIDEFINFTNEFEIQQKLTTCQGKIFQYIAGQRMRQGYSPDGQVQIKYKK